MLNDLVQRCRNGDAAAWEETLLGTETVKDRECYHLVFTREVPAVTAGELISHLWIDQGTWLRQYLTRDGA